MLFVEDRFNVHLSLSDFFIAPTITLMAAMILERKNKVE